jgi:hypothetical protein
MIYKTIIDSSESITSPLRAYLPSTIKKLLVDRNSIWAYGSDSLILVDNRSENIVLKLNKLP